MNKRRRRLARHRRKERKDAEYVLGKIRPKNLTIKRFGKILESVTKRMNERLGHLGVALGGLDAAHGQLLDRLAESVYNIPRITSESDEDLTARIRAKISSVMAPVRVDNIEIDRSKDLSKGVVEFKIDVLLPTPTKFSIDINYGEDDGDT